MTSKSAPVASEYSEPRQAIFWLFLFYVLFLYLQGGFRFPALGAWRIEFVMGGIMLPFAITQLPRSITQDSRRLLGWAIALLLCMGVMVALSQFPAYSFDVWWDRGVKFSIYGACIAAFVTSPRRLRLFVLAFLLAFLKMAEEGLLGALSGGLMWQNQEVLRLHGATPNYDHPNSFSATQLGTVPFLYYLYPLLPWYWRLSILVQAGLCAHVIVRAGSRTTYLGLIGTVLALIWQSQKRLKTTLMVVLVGALLAPVIPAEYIGRFESTFTDTSEVGAETSIGKRKEILVDATEIFAEYPFGVGVGAFPLVRQEKFGRDQDTHNLYLEVATNLGIHGSVIFLGFIICLWRTLMRLAKKLASQVAQLERLPQGDERVQRQLDDLKFMKATADALWVFLIIRLIVGAFGMDMYEVYWWFMSGLTIALFNINRTATVKTVALVKESGNNNAIAAADSAAARKPSRALPAR